MRNDYSTCFLKRKELEQKKTNSLNKLSNYSNLIIEIDSLLLFSSDKELRTEDLTKLWQSFHYFWWLSHYILQHKRWFMRIRHLRYISIKKRLIFYKSLKEQFYKINNCWNDISRNCMFRIIYEMHLESGYYIILQPFYSKEFQIFSISNI